MVREPARGSGAPEAAAPTLAVEEMLQWGAGCVSTDGCGRGPGGLAGLGTLEPVSGGVRKAGSGRPRGPSWAAQAASGPALDEPEGSGDWQGPRRGLPGDSVCQAGALAACGLQFTRRHTYTHVHTHAHDTHKHTHRRVSTCAHTCTCARAHDSHASTRAHTPPHACAQAHSCTHTGTHTCIGMCAHTHTCTQAHLCTHGHADTHRYVRAHTHTCTHTGTHARIGMCVHIPTHVRTGTLRHTHRHTYPTRSAPILPQHQTPGSRGPPRPRLSPPRAPPTPSLDCPGPGPRLGPPGGLPQSLSRARQT